MNNLKDIIKNQFKIKKWSAHATYALAYASDPTGILDSMRLSRRQVINYYFTHWPQFIKN